MILFGVSKVVDLGGHVSITERNRTFSRCFLILKDFSLPCQHGEDQSDKSCARDWRLQLYGVEECLIQIRNILSSAHSSVATVVFAVSFIAD